MVIENVGSI